MIAFLLNFVTAIIVLAGVDFVLGLLGITRPLSAWIALGVAILVFLMSPWG